MTKSISPRKIKSLCQDYNIRILFEHKPKPGLTVFSIPRSRMNNMHQILSFANAIFSEVLDLPKDKLIDYNEDYRGSGIRLFDDRYILTLDLR